MTNPDATERALAEVSRLGLAVAQAAAMALEVYQSTETDDELERHEVICLHLRRTERLCRTLIDTIPNFVP